MTTLKDYARDFANEVLDETGVRPLIKFAETTDVKPGETQRQIDEIIDNLVEQFIAKIKNRLIGE